MTKLIVQKITLGQRGNVNAQFLEKSINEQFTIGKTNCDIIYMINTMSRNHGRIFIENGLFTQHIDYEDYSSNGTVILNWRQGKCRAQHIKKTKIKIHPGDWIMITEQDQEVRVGLILIPIIQ